MTSDGSIEKPTAADVLWAKLSIDSCGWLPLKVHMRDTTEVSCRLWDEWLSESTRNAVSNGINIKTPGYARQLIGFLAASHDIGKASPEFQAKIGNRCEAVKQRIVDVGLRWGYLQGLATPHALVSMLILEHNGVDRSVSDIIGSHHGLPPSSDMVSRRRLSGYSSHTGFTDQGWVSVQDALFDAAVEISGIDRASLSDTRVSIPAQDILVGIIIMADWIASNADCFPLVPISDVPIHYPPSRASAGWEKMDFPQHSGLVYGRSISFNDAFGFDPRPFQSTALEAVEHMEDAGVVVVEAPTGEGKTEAALAIAESLSRRFGQNGLFFGLPTQATANGVFTRVHSWMEKCSGSGTRTLLLAHGKSRFNDEFESIPRTGWDVGDDGSDDIVVHQWFGGKKGMLSDVVVGTVDQALMAGLKRRHLPLRHLGFSEKVVIIDECHAYDEYMGSYLRKALRWFGSFGAPVVLMSATLPPDTKRGLISAYLGKDCGVLEDEGYPQVTCATKSGITVTASQGSGRRMEVSIRYLRYDEIADVLADHLSQGGYAGIIVNTVRRAQEIYDTITEAFPDADVILIHSAFTCIDRSRKEKEVIDTLSERISSRPVIVVGTQVLEQSLDIDFDILLTDLCPIDLLIQRVGRLHRHRNIRPQPLTVPICYIIGDGAKDLDPGSVAVYGRYQLMNAQELLRGRHVLDIPDEVPGLVEAAYSQNGLEVPSEISIEYSAAKAEMEKLVNSRESKARTFQIQDPGKMENLIGWLDCPRDDPDGMLAEATVRDTDGSVEAILVYRTGEGAFFIDPDGTGTGVRIPSDCTPDDMLARTMSDCTISIPHALIGCFGMKGVLNGLERIRREEIPEQWMLSGWLSGELFLIADEAGQIGFNGAEMRYDSNRGLQIIG